MIIKGDGPDRLCVGKLVSDPKTSTFGEKQYMKTRFGVRCADGGNGIINVETMFELAERCKELKKFDNVIVVGKLDNWEGSDGEKHWFLNAELVTADLGVIYRAYGKTVNEAPQIGFTEIADNDLPFD